MIKPITLKNLKLIADKIRADHPDHRYKFRDWNKSTIPHVEEFVSTNPSIEAIEKRIAERIEHNKCCLGTLREYNDLIEEKILKWVINNQIDEILGYCGMLGSIELEKGERED